MRDVRVTRKQGVAESDVRRRNDYGVPPVPGMASERPGEQAASCSDRRKIPFFLEDTGLGADEHGTACRT